jgi:glycosyltransferase involved in cell wall biosynthesis
MSIVSVTIPCYNGEPFLGTAIESVLGQTFQDFEIIVVDDGSHDRSGDVVRKWKDPRIRYYYQTNQGLAATRNRLIDLAEGKYIALLDQDDFWEPRKLEAQLAVFARNHETVLVYSDCFVVDENKHVKGRWSQRTRAFRGAVFEPLLQVNFIPIPTVLVRRDALLEVGKFQPYKVCEEYDVFLKLAEKYHFDYVAEPLASYRVHPHQYSKHYEKELLELLAIYDEWGRAPRGHWKAKLTRSRARAYFNAGKSAMYRDADVAKARHWFHHSLRQVMRLRVLAFYVMSYLGPGMIKTLRRLTVRTLGTYSFSE